MDMESWPKSVWLLWARWDVPQP